MFLRKLFLVGCCLVALASNAQDKKYKVAIIGFYNLENLYDTINDPLVNDDEFTPDGQKNYTPKVYLDKLDKLSDVLSQIGTDYTADGAAILGVAEVENEQVLKDLAQTSKLKKRNWQTVHYHSPDERGVDVAMFYNPKYFKPTYSESLNVPLKNDDGSLRKTRDILYVKGLLDGEVVHVFVNHWPSRRGGEEASAPWRALAASVCKAKVDSITGDDLNAKVVVMGDLNDDPVSPSVTHVMAATGDLEKVKAGGFFNPWVDLYKNGLGTLAYNDAWNLFDQILITNSWLDTKQQGFHYQKAMVFKRQFMMQQTGRYKGYAKRTYDFNIYIGGYSDHFPTYLLMLKEVK